MYNAFLPNANFNPVLSYGSWPNLRHFCCNNLIVWACVNNAVNSIVMI